MNIKEVGEIRRHIRRDRSNMPAIYGCYVNDNKEIVAEFRSSTGMMSENESEIYELATKLCLYNTERQKYCDELYLSAKRKLVEKGAYGNVIMLSDESWNAGFVGIVAATFAAWIFAPALLALLDNAIKSGDKPLFKAKKKAKEEVAEAPATQEQAEQPQA